MAIILHPETGVPIEGERIESGSVLRAGDMYASTTGKWHENPCPGLALLNDHVVWVRPLEKKVSLDEGDPILKEAGRWFKKLNHPDNAAHKIAFARRNPEILKFLCPGD